MGWHFSMCSLTCIAMQGQKKQSCIRSSIHSRPKWPTSSWHPLRVVSLCADWQNQLDIGPLWIPLVAVFLSKNAPPHFKVVVFPKELSMFRRIGLFELTVGPEFCLLVLTITRLKDWIYPLSLVPVIYGHAGDLNTVPYRVQDVQITAICFADAPWVL